MATKQMYESCVARSKALGRRDVRTGRVVPSETDLKDLFGEVLLVEESELAGCAEAEKRRHLHQNKILRSMYIEN